MTNLKVGDQEFAGLVADTFRGLVCVSVGDNDTHVGNNGSGRIRNGSKECPALLRRSNGHAACKQERNGQ